MRNKLIKHFLILVLFCSAVALRAQSPEGMDEVIINNPENNLNKANEEVDYGLFSEKQWRTTGASFTLTGAEMEHMTTGNLLNTLQGRIPGLTVVSGSGEPGYDSPSFIGRGLSSWNLTEDNLLIYLDGFEVCLSALASLSPNEIESVTYLKDAALLSIYGMEGGCGVLSVKTKRGIAGKTQITANGRCAVQSVIDLPTVMNAYDYTRLNNQARENDDLTIRYPDPDLYKNGGDETHPDVDWYDEVLRPYSYIEDCNLSFRGGGDNARYFVLMDYTNFTGLYKDADELGGDYGTNAEYTKFNLRGNIDINSSKNFSVKAQITGSIEDKDTPNGFTASELFTSLMDIPAAAFSVKNPDGTWGNSSTYDFNPVMLLKTGGIWNSHTRNLQTNFSFNEKLDAITPGLSANGGLSLSNQYIGYTSTSYSVLSYELEKDDDDEAILDDDGNYTYSEIGSISDDITDGETSHWNRQTIQLGLNYNRSFGKHTFTGMLLAKRQSYTYYGLTYEFRNQGISFNATYDYDKTYIVNLSGGYTGSADFEKGSRYGLFPSLALGWIASNEDFLKDNTSVNFLKVRASYGLTGNTNSSYRFLYEQWAEEDSGWEFTSSNTWYTGYREGDLPNSNFTWEQKATANIGFDAQLFKKLSVTLDVFTEKRSQILEDATADIPEYTGFRLSDENTGAVRNSGFEAVVGYDDNVGSFEYYAKAMVSFARNKIIKKSETEEPYDWLYEQGYRINQYRGLICDGFYQTSDFDDDGLLKDDVVSSTYTNVQAGDLKFVDQNGDGIINDYDVVPIGYTDIPEITIGLNLGFKYKKFDFDAFFQGVTNRSVFLPSDYVTPFVDNNNITIFSNNAWTEETATTATSPRLSTKENLNNEADSDFWLRDGSFIKLRSIELGYSTSIGGKSNVRIFLNGTNLFTWDKIADLEAENLSEGYPLVKAISLGLKANF